MAELVSAVNSLKDASEGPDEVHNSMLRHLPLRALQTLLNVFNSLWEKGEFPPGWREAVIIPLLKPGKSGFNALDYRPISLTSTLCKLMERMVNCRLIWFLEHNNFFASEQCGFRKYRSTMDHIVRLDTVIRTAFKKKKHVGAVFFDIEAAYDATWQHGIISKLFKCGIRGSMDLFLQNFFISPIFLNAHRKSSFS